MQGHGARMSKHKILLWSWTKLIFIFLSFFSNAYAERRQSIIDTELRFRGFVSYGSVNYTSDSAITNAKTELKGTQWGGHGELEVWSSHHSGFNFEADGIQADFPDQAAGFKGKPILQTYGSFNLIWRILGRGGVENSELALLAGPTIVSYSDVRAFQKKGIYDLVRVNVWGTKGGLRWRQSLIGQWLFELSGYWLYPHRFLQRVYNSAHLRSGETMAYGFSSLLEYHYLDGISYGVGWNYQVNRLSYNDSGKFQTVRFDRSAPFIMLLLWL